MLQFSRSQIFSLSVKNDWKKLLKELEYIYY